MERWCFTTTLRGTKMDFYNAFFEELNIHQIFEGFVYVHGLHCVKLMVIV